MYRILSFLVVLSITIFFLEAIHLFIPKEPESSFTGSLDTVFHIAHFVAYFVHPIAVLILIFILTTRVNTDHMVFPVVLILFATLQIWLNFTIDPRVGSSRYIPTPPDYLGSTILLILTISSSKPINQFWLGRVVIAVASLFWLNGVLVDGIWDTEKTARGVGAFWQLPGVSSLSTGTFLFMTMVSWPLIQIKSIYFSAAISTILFGYIFYRTKCTLNCVAVGLSIFLLFLKIPMWVSFFLD